MRKLATLAVVAAALWSQPTYSDGPVFANPAALASSSVLLVPTTVAAVLNVSGSPPAAYGAAGVSTCALTYLRGTTTPTGLFGEVLNVPSGIYWEPNYSQSPVKTCEFGAIGDGVWNQTTGAVTGTDNTAIIQAALDFAMRNQFETVCLNDGKYLITDTLQMGWGQGFFSLSMTSCGGGQFNYFGLAGVAILPNKTDRCAVNIQGGRADSIRRITFIGQNYAWMNNTSFLATGGNYPTVNSGWLNPALIPSGSNPGGLQQHSPYAAICIDAYKGTQPTDHYPTVTYPAWTGISTQYSKAPSSNTRLSEVEVIGFAVGAVSSPNGDGNGDFTEVDGMDCTYGVYCLAVGNTQSRNVTFTNSQACCVFAMYTNDQFGVQQGKTDGPMTNLSCGNCYELFQVGLSGAQGLFVINNAYAEATVRVGEFDGGGASTQTVIFNGGDFTFDESNTGVSPATLFYNGGSGTVNLALNGVSLSNPSRIAVLVSFGFNVSINGGTWQAAQQMGTLFGTTAGQIAINWTGSIFTGGALTYLTNGGNNFGLVTWLNTVNAVAFTNPTTQGNQSLQRLLGFNNSTRASITQAASGFSDANTGKVWTFAINGQGATPLDLSNSATSVHPSFSSCDTVNFTYFASLQNAGPYTKMVAGDLIFNDVSDSLFVITAVGSPDGSGNFPITARQLNNMQLNHSTFACTTNNISNPTLTGNDWLFQTNIPDIPSNVFFGTFTSGSTSVTNVQRGDGFGANFTSYVNAGDEYFGYSIQDSYFQWPYVNGSTIATVTNGSPGSATLSANATQSGRFPFIPLPVTGGPQ